VGVDRLDLLRAIAARRDDVALRLVYADWLEEHGDVDRATRVRMECALDGVPAYAPAFVELGRWLGGKPDVRVDPEPPPGFELVPLTSRCGFHEEVYVHDVEAFARHAADYFAIAPIRGIRVSAHGGLDLARLLACDALARLDRLEISGAALDRRQVDRLADAPHLASLTRVGLTFGGVTEDGLAALLHSPLVQRLDALDLRTDFFVERGLPIARAFGAAPPLPRLRHLEVGGNRLDAVALQPVLDLDAELERLGVSDNPLGRDGWRALAASYHRLHWLDANKTEPGVDGVRALASSHLATSLRCLDASKNTLGVQAARALGGVTWPRLEFLDLSWSHLGEAGVHALADRASVFPSLLRADVRTRGLSGAAQGLADRWFEATSRIA
jgi:uncharacterized protein (TIGR02996 family)